MKASKRDAAQYLTLKLNGKLWELWQKNVGAFLHVYLLIIVVAHLKKKASIRLGALSDKTETVVTEQEHKEHCPQKGQTTY